MSLRPPWLLALFLASLLPVVADQPIMNMMPRWNGGYGAQAILQSVERDKLLDGEDSVGDFSEEFSVLHLEGVYTWTKAVRATVKIPFVLDATRELPGGEDGEGVITQHDSGVGDATVAVPLKKYINEDGASGSFSFTPQVRIPLGHERDEYEVYDGDWGLGLGLSWERETYRTFVALGATGWTFFGSDNDELDAHFDFGINFLDRGQALIETDLQMEDIGESRIITGPALYWRFSDFIHGRLEWKRGIHDDQGSELDHGHGEMFRAGLGFVY